MTAQDIEHAWTTGEGRQVRLPDDHPDRNTFEPATRPADGVWGTIDGVPVTDDVVDEVVKNAEAGFPGATFRAVGRPHRP